MVGVPKSTGCFICRKRKIKCDETWPNCLNCQKNIKLLICPGPPARHTFKNLGPRLNANNLTVPADGNVSALSNQRCRRLTQLNEKFAENGSVLHKFRISNKEDRAQKKISRRLNSPGSSPPNSPLLRQPSPSQHHELARALIAATNTGTAGHRMSVFGPFIREVPGRIGHNAALDAAVAVLVNAHTSLVHKKISNEIVSPGLYLRAIKTLQTCLEDPQQGMSSNTLCASIILGLVEALAGPRLGNRYLAHVGGAGRLMELQGPKQYQDSFAKEILRFNRGGIIVTSLYERRPCFLLSPDWQEIAFDKTGLSFDDCLHTDVMQCMADLPGIFHDSKDLDNQIIDPSIDSVAYELGVNESIQESLGQYIAPKLSNLNFTPDTSDNIRFLDNIQRPNTTYSITTARAALLYRVQALKETLNALGAHLNAKLTDGITILEMTTVDEDSPIRTSYHFNNWRDMTAYNCFWSILILTNKVLMRLLPPFDPEIYSLQSECRSVALQICKSWENAWATKPIGAFHTGLSFVVAYEFCSTEVKEWIIKSLNSLVDYQMVDAFRWSEDLIVMMSSKLAGEGPDLIFTYANMTITEVPQ